MATSGQAKIKGRWVQGGVLVVVSMAALALLVPLWLEVTGKLEEMRTARRDNVIWTVVQLEVEYLELERAAHQIEHLKQEGLPELHRRFNVFYSRVGTLRQSPIYRSAIIEAGEAGNLEIVYAGLERMLPLMDGPEADLVAQYPTLLAQLHALHVPTRRIVANGSFVLTSRTEEAREEAARLVGRLGVASLVLFSGLLGLALLFSRLYVVYKRRARDNLQTSQRLATVVATSPDAIIVTDDAGRIRDFNPAAQTLLAYDRDEALGSNLSKMIASVDGACVALPIKQQNFFRRRMVGRGRDGRSIPLEVSQGATSLESLRVYVYFLRDITDRLNSEEALRGSRDRALAGERAKAHFLAVMSHEMRTPLNGILGVVDLMKDRHRDARDRHYLSLLENSGQVLLGHVNEVLDITEIEARGIRLTNAPFHLDALLHEVVASLRPAAEAKGNELRLTVDPDPMGHFLGDVMRLRQIVANLVSNAIKFTSDGQIDLMVSASVNGADAFVEIQVADTGIGIDDDNKGRVFDDFVRLERGRASQVEGTGLGLGIVRRIVMAMGGQIGVDSVKGEGSLFWVTLNLPFAADQQGGDGVVDTPPAPRPYRPLDVLLVEDNPTNRFVMREMLEHEGHTVTEAENGQIGADLARERFFDLILMDISMPVMGGVEATRLVRGGGASRSTRIVALTAHVLDQDAALYREAGIDRVLSKPISRRNIVRVLRGEPALQDRDGVVDVVLDSQVLTHMRSALGAEKTAEVVSQVLEDGEALIARLESDENGDLEALACQVHSFAGAGAIVGAQALHVSLSRLEEVLSHHVDIAHRRAAIQTVQSNWAKTRPLLQKQLQ